MFDICLYDGLFELISLDTYLLLVCATLFYIYNFITAVSALPAHTQEHIYMAARFKVHFLDFSYTCYAVIKEKKKNWLLGVITAWIFVHYSLLSYVYA